MSEKRYELDVRLDMPKLLIDNVTNKRYHLLLVNDIEEIVDLLNELSDENNILNKNEDDLKECTIENIKLREENEQLKSYIDSIFLGSTHICKELDIEDAMFYCEKEEKHIYPNCLYHKCFDEENLVEVKEEIRKCNDE